MLFLQLLHLNCKFATYTWSAQVYVKSALPRTPLPYHHLSDNLEHKTMNMTTWWLALALMLLCEGALIGIAPAVWRRTMRQLGELPDNALRRIGLGMAATALLIVAMLLWLAH